MADDKTRATNAEGQPINDNMAPAAGDPAGQVDFDKLTFEGEPVFVDVTTDPETGDLLSYSLSPEIQAKLNAKYSTASEMLADLMNNEEAEQVFKQVRAAAQQTLEPLTKAAAEAAKVAGFIRKTAEPAVKLTAAIKDITDNLLTDETRETIRVMRDSLQAIQDLINEIEALTPYLKAELDKPEYEGKTLDFVMNNNTARDLIDLLQDHDSYFYKAIKAARAARAAEQATRTAQQAGRKERQALRQNAKESGAIMEIRDGKLSLFSSQMLWDAFAPNRICRMGTLDKSVIDADTGLIKKVKFAPGEIEAVDPADISIKAFALLSAIIKNSVDDIYTEFVKGGDIKFYVKGVLENFTDDPRTLSDNQLNLDRKTAGVIYLEKMLEPLLGYIGTTDNGSRYTVLNYVGYDALSDTMIIQTPYLYQLWRYTQAAYFERRKNLEIAQANNKKPAKKDLTPLETNELFKGKAYTANEITLEIAVYITNVLLTAGNTGRLKKTEITYKKIIKNCPRFESKLSEIEARPNTETLPDGTVKNNASTYNAELKKIKSAFDLILDPEKCDATRLYEFQSITPSRKKKNGGFEVIAPTKSKLNDKIVISWRRKTEQNEI